MKITRNQLRRLIREEVNLAVESTQRDTTEQTKKARGEIGDKLLELWSAMRDKEWEKLTFKQKVRLQGDASKACKELTDLFYLAVNAM